MPVNIWKYKEHYSFLQRKFKNFILYIWHLGFFKPLLAIRISSVGFLKQSEKLAFVLQTRTLGNLLRQIMQHFGTGTPESASSKGMIIKWTTNDSQCQVGYLIVNKGRETLQKKQRGNR
jgi:hypothetical protein